MMLGTRKLEQAMDRAENYDEWKEAAQAFDTAKGFDRWRSKDTSTQYDNVSIRIRLDRLRALRARHDNRGLLFTLNEGIHGNMGGMGKSGLYDRAMFGTKQLIVDYVDEIVDALELLASPAVDDISFEEKLEFFRRAHHCFGRSALMMSGWRLVGAPMTFSILMGTREKTVAATTLGIDIRQLAEKIERANGVVGLQPQNVLHA